MKHFRDKSGYVFAFDEDQLKIDWVIEKAKAMTAMTKKDVDLHLNPQKTKAQIDAEWKANRQAALDSATVIISTGKVFDADEKSITRMAESKQAVLDAIEVGLIATKEDYPLQWVLACSETGVGTPITYAELVEASALANQNRAKIWLKS